MPNHLSETRLSASLRPKDRWAATSGLCAVVLWVGACGLSASAGAPEEYRLEIGDVLEVSVAGMPDMRQRLPVQLDGSISYPNLGRLAVIGTTIAETQRAIQTALSSQMFRQRLADGRELTITVEPREISAVVVEYRPVYVDGDVSRPGEQTYRPLMTVRQAISVAGGYDLLRFGTKTPAADVADARGEYEAVTADLAKETANIGRIRRELGEKDATLGPSTAGAALPQHVLRDLQKSQADLLDSEQGDYARERTFLKRGLDQLAAQSDILSRQQKDEEKGLKIDTEELERLTELLGRGATIAQRVTDARRAALLSSTRALQTTAQLMQATRQREEFMRQLERLDDLRRAKLLTDLSDRIAKAQQLQARARALNLKMAGLAAKPQDDFGARRLPVIQIIRRNADGHERLPAHEDSELRPGDVVEVALKASTDVAAARP